MTTLTFEVDSSAFVSRDTLPPPKAIIIDTVKDSFTLTERLAEQVYFWTPEWQEGEQEADEDIKAGRTRRFSSVKEAIAYLDSSEE